MTPRYRVFYRIKRGDSFVPAGKGIAGDTVDDSAQRAQNAYPRAIEILVVGSGAYLYRVEREPTLVRA